MKEFIINSNDAKQRLDKFIQKSVPRLPQSMMYKAIRNKRIKINGKRAEISTRLQTGDIVQMYINDEFFDTAIETEFMAAPA
ncbi:MAG: RluA family pseudouridine synthase, partial [Oscillospiraceae bacterium]|nr:RluA family pseudouridine synthase [Oscillospiraceae bacterium]